MKICLDCIGYILGFNDSKEVLVNCILLCKRVKKHVNKEYKELYDIVKESYIIELNKCEYVYDKYISGVREVHKNHRHIIRCTRMEYIYINTLLNIPHYISEEGFDKYRRIETMFINAKVKSNKTKNKNAMMRYIVKCKTIYRFMAKYNIKDLYKFTYNKFKNNTVSNISKDSVIIYDIVLDILDILQEIDSGMFKFMYDIIEQSQYEKQFDYSFKIHKITDNTYDVLYLVKDKIGISAKDLGNKLEKCSILLMRLREIF
jgi:hypothetical protein